LISPAPSSTYRLDPGLDSESQKLLIEAIAGGGFIEISLWVDGTLLGRFAQEPYRAWWELSPGGHQAWVEGIREDGEKITSEITQFSVEQ
jgi:hypothetical protein